MSKTVRTDVGKWLTARGQSVVDQVAQVSLTVVRAVKSALTFTQARCPKCNKLVLVVPGTPAINTRVLRSNNDGSGDGRIVECRRCSHLVEVVESNG